MIPVRSDTPLRPVKGVRIGTTAFFRNTAFLMTLAELLRKVKQPAVLFHGCSNGAEPYSFAMVWREVDGGQIQIDATDVEPSFVNEARNLTHPKLDAVARAMVRFLPPASVANFHPERRYDAVACMNVLCYLSEREQRDAIASMAGYATRYLCITAADPHLIGEEIKRAGFVPMADNWIAIYYGWRERLSWLHRKQWKLPYIPMLMPNWRYSGSSIFRRADHAGEIC
jgi:chemotaxis methyl-accepting protein methylase